MKRWMGIDPGKKGGIAIIDQNRKLETFPMQDPQELDQIFKRVHKSLVHVFLEKAQALSKGGKAQGVKSMFTYGEGYGIIQGLLIAYKIPFTLVTPQFWQKTMFLGTTAMTGSTKRNPKDRALEAANRVFAKSNSFWLPSTRCRKPHDGMIDAALIAEASRRLA